jgi:hypothetical protein
VSTEELPDPDCANAITVEPWVGGDEGNIRVEVACQLDRGGCGWSCSFPGTPELRRISWTEVIGEVEKHLHGRGPIAAAEMRGYERAVANLLSPKGKSAAARIMFSAIDDESLNGLKIVAAVADVLDAMKENNYA